MSVRRFLLIFVFCFLYVVTNAIPLGGTGLGDYFPEKLSISGNVTILNGGLSVSQTVTANLFVGNGSGLTHLPAVSTANLALTSNISVSMDAQGLMGAISVATGNTIMSITTAGNVGIGTKNPLSNLDVVGSFRFRDAENPSKGFRYRFGGATDVEGGGSDIYFSV